MYYWLIEHEGREGPGPDDHSYEHTNTEKASVRLIECRGKEKSAGDY